MRKNLIRWMQLDLRPADAAILAEMMEEAGLDALSRSEDDPAGFERGLDAIKGGRPCLGVTGLDVADRHKGEAGGLGKPFLGPSE